MPARRLVPGLLILICLCADVSARVPIIRDHVGSEREALLVDSSAKLFGDGSASLRAERFYGSPALQSLDMMLLMCDFSDSLLYGRHDLVTSVFPEPRQSDWMYAAHDSVYFEGLMEDVGDYFHDASGGLFELRTEIPQLVANLSRPMAFYGNHPELGEQPLLLAIETLAELDGQVDFSGYDTIVIVHAGAGEETDILGDSPEQIYTTYIGPEDLEAAVEEGLIDSPWLETDDFNAPDDPVRIKHILILPENEYQDPIGGVGGNFGSVGVYCFEVGLRLGMLSLSDFTPAGVPDSQGIGQFGLMGYGLFSGAGIIPSQPCAFNKMLMGWLDPYDVDPDAGDFYSLFPSEQPAADSTLARVEIGPSEYWLLEYRLQDPDGNMDFSFPGDLNGNGLPDFDNAVYDTLDFSLERFFDPELDVRERLAGAEFDFFLSDNSARAPGIKAAGSGLYIWHIDEGVIRRVIELPQNLLNADPDRKAVDLEEADGIQDLDVRIPTPFVLGGDDDSFRGENNAQFGVDTNPSTSSAAGVPTGIVIDMISDVVVDSFAIDPLSGASFIDYADRMRFRCRRIGSRPGLPGLRANRQLPDTDLRGSHLVAADLDGAVNDALEIIVAADRGRILVFNADLSDLSSGAAEPGLWAVGSDEDGQRVRWNGYPVLGDFDGDGELDVILSADNGLYAYRGSTGEELTDGDLDPDSEGLFLDLDGCRLPPVLWPATEPTAIDGQVDVIVCEEDATMLHRLRSIRFDGGSVDYPAPDGSWRTLMTPVIWRDELILPLVSTDEQRGVIWLPRLAELIELPEIPSALSMLPTASGLLIPARQGAILMTELDAASVSLWSADQIVHSGFAPGPAFVSDGVFLLSGNMGAPRTNWPYRPQVEVFAPDPQAAPTPLVYSLDGRRHFLFTALDGRLFLCDDQGRAAAGWPLAGPGQTAGTPLLLDLDGLPGLELMAAGSFDRINGPPDGEAPPASSFQSSIMSWTLADTEDAETVWPMHGGSIGGLPPVLEGQDDSLGETLIVPGSHIVYPLPVIGDDLHVRVICNQDVLLSVRIYNLEGEEVHQTSGRRALAGDPFEIVLPAGRMASGPYLCRLEANSGRRSEISVISLVVAR